MSSLKSLPALRTSVTGPEFVFAAVAVYVVAEIVFALLVFDQLSLFSRVAGVVLFALIPLFQMRNLGRKFFCLPLRLQLYLAGASLPVAAILLAFRSASLALWEPRYPAYPAQSIDDGFVLHKDSAFHVTLIQQILSRGYPSTGQHLEPTIHYHALSHYFDAAILFLLRLEPFASYGFLFNLKGIGLVALTATLSLSLTRKWLVNFWYVFPPSLLAVAGTWFSVGSHGQWVPVFLLLLASPWLSATLRRERAKFWDLALITLLITTVSLGKISLGFSLAAFVGFHLVLRRQLDPMIVGFGAVWLGFFYLWQQGFDTGTRPSGVSEIASQFYSALPETTSLLFISGLGLACSKVFSSIVLRRDAVATLAGFVTALVVAIWFTTKQSEAWLFFHGLFLVAFLLMLPNFIQVFSPSSSGTKTGPGKPGGFVGALALSASMILFSSPVLAATDAPPKAPSPPYVSSKELFSIGEHVVSLLVPDSRLDTGAGPRAGTGGANTVGHEIFLDQMGFELQSLIHDNGLRSSEVLLFVSEEDYSAFEDYSGLSKLKFGGLLLTAATGLTLVHSVGEPNMMYFGFQDYGAEAHRIASKDVDVAGLCKFERPVVRALDLMKLEFVVECVVP